MSIVTDSTYQRDEVYRAYVGYKAEGKSLEKLKKFLLYLMKKYKMNENFSKSEVDFIIWYVQESSEIQLLIRGNENLIRLQLVIAEIEAIRAF